MSIKLKGVKILLLCSLLCLIPEMLCAQGLEHVMSAIKTLAFLTVSAVVMLIIVLLNFSKERGTLNAVTLFSSLLFICVPFILLETGINIIHIIVFGISGLGFVSNVHYFRKNK